MKKNIKSIKAKKNFFSNKLMVLYIFLLPLIFSCKEQDVISNIRSLNGYGILNVNLSDKDGKQVDGSYPNISIRASKFINVKLENVGGLNISKLALPKSLPPPLFYEDKANAHSILDNLTQSPSIKVLDSKYSEIVEGSETSTQSRLAILNKSLPNHISKNCSDLTTRSDSLEKSSCNFRIYAYAEKNTTFYLPIEITYNDGINNQKVTINFTGYISDAGELYFSQEVNKETDQFIREWRTISLENKLSFAQECAIPDLESTPDFTRGFIEKYEGTTNFTPDGPLAFGLNKSKLITLFNYGQEELKIYKSEFSHLTLKSNNTNSINTFDLCSAKAIEITKNIPIPEGYDSKGESFFGFNGGKFPGTNGNCTTTLKPKESCQVEINYEPKELIEDGGDTHKGILKISYSDVFEKNENGKAKKKDLLINLSGTSKKDRAKVIITDVGPAISEPSCPGEKNQACKFLGKSAYGTSEFFLINVENIGIVNATLYPPLLKYEIFGLESVMLPLSDDKNNYIKWLGHGYTPEDKKILDQLAKNNITLCDETLGSGEKCSFPFRFISNGVVPLEVPEYELVSRLLQIRYNDNDVVNPSEQTAKIKNNKVKEDLKDRVNITMEITRPGTLEIDKVVEDGETDITNNLFASYTDSYYYSFPPQVVAPRSPRNITISFANRGEFQVSEIEVVSEEKNYGINFNRSNCPEIVKENSSTSCQIIITAEANENDIYHNSFKIRYFNGFNYQETELFKIDASFSNSSVLRFSTLIEKSSLFEPISDFNNQFILQSLSPSFQVYIRNFGLSKANIDSFNLSTKMTCEGFDSPIGLSLDSSSSCLNKVITEKNTEDNSCYFQFQLQFNVDEILSLPEVPSPFNSKCSFQYEIKYEDDFTKTMTEFNNLPSEKKLLKSESSTIYFEIGEAPKIVILNEEEYKIYKSLQNRSDIINMAKNTSRRIADFKTNQKILDNFQYAEEQAVYVVNYGGITAMDIIYSSNQPDVFKTRDGKCSTVQSFSACELDIVFTPTGDQVYDEDFYATYKNGKDTITETFKIDATSGKFGLLIVEDFESSPLKSNDSIPIKDLIIGSTEKVVLTIKNIGEGPAILSGYNDSISNSDEDGNLIISEDQRRLSTSTCTINLPLTLGPGETCELHYEINIIDDSQKKVSVYINYLNTNDSKTYSFNIKYSGTLPPNVKPEFVGDYSPNSFHFGTIPKFVSKEKSFYFRNIGKTDAANFSVQLSQESNEYFKIFYNTCDFQNQILPTSDVCEVKIRYSPLEESEIIINSDTSEKELVPHTGEIIINYDPIIEPEVPLPKKVQISGTAIIPNSDFTYWKDIKAVSGESTTQISFSWDSFTKPDENIEIDSYNIYRRENEPLPKDLNGLKDFYHTEVTENVASSRSFSEEFITVQGKKIYYSVRAKYLGEILDITKDPEEPINPWDLKIVTPPTNMALIHPFIANDITCRNMKYRPDFENSINQENILSGIEPLTTPYKTQFSCPMKKIENEIVDDTTPQFSYEYYNFSKFLFVDLYELSKDPYSGALINSANQQPAEFVIPISATSACESVSVNLETANMTKRLLNREEWFIASTWPEDYSSKKVDEIETGLTSQDCYYNKELSPDKTGNHLNCQSRFGIYDMVGNLWEWNSNQINVIIGLDELLGDNFLIPGSNAISFPAQTPCYSYIQGLAYLPKLIDGVESCDESLPNSQIKQRTASYYFPPSPMNKKLKNIRSGGGVGEKIGATSSTIKLTGRHVVDLDAYSANGTGARCGFSLPYTND